MPESPGQLDGPNDLGPRFQLDTPRRGEGSGFIIDADGSILTNNHVIDRAERITVKLADGRTLRAHVVGSDPDTDIALIKVDGQTGLPVAPLGDSSTLRMGEWVVAIGDPLGYEHSVTVGVVSYIGRKLFDASLDSYIQTDAAINFGNSGGPLINARGEVIGINAAISARGSSIGFAVPINLASSILPQLRARGRVSRGYIGVALRDIDDDLQRLVEADGQPRRARAGRHAGLARRARRPAALRRHRRARRQSRRQRRRADSRYRGARARHGREAPRRPRRPRAGRHGEARGAAEPRPRAADAGRRRRAIATGAMRIRRSA